MGTVTESELLAHVLFQNPISSADMPAYLRPASVGEEDGLAVGNCLRRLPVFSRFNLTKNRVGQDHESALRILYIPAPHSGHLPFIAGRPFFIVTRSVSFMTLFALHFTQYASSIVTSTLLINS